MSDKGWTLALMIFGFIVEEVSDKPFYDVAGTTAFITGFMGFIVSLIFGED